MKTVPVSGSLLAVLAVVVLVGSACGPGDSESEAEVSEVQGSEAPSVQVDHIIMAVGDLETGMEEFEEMTGVRPVFGGEHPGRGTRNALADLGPRVYLEILALQEGVEEVEDAPGLAGLTSLTPWGWAASTPDLEATLALLEDSGFVPSETAAGSRATPDGGLLKWSTGYVEEPVLAGSPFFIEWDVESPHPATTSPGGCKFEALKVMTPDHEGLGSFMEILGLPVEVRMSDGSEEGYEFTLRCPAGTVTFR
jgi:hypothetical protein